MRGKHSREETTRHPRGTWVGYNKSRRAGEQVFASGAYPEENALREKFDNYFI